LGLKSLRMAPVELLVNSATPVKGPRFFISKYL
jgi:hypothetical protein